MFFYVFYYCYWLLVLMEFVILFVSLCDFLLIFSPFTYASLCTFSFVYCVVSFVCCVYLYVCMHLSLCECVHLYVCLFKCTKFVYLLCVFNCLCARVFVIVCLYVCNFLLIRIIPLLFITYFNINSKLLFVLSLGLCNFVCLCVCH